MSLSPKLDRIAARADELRAMLSDTISGEGYVRASKELAEIEPIVGRIGELRDAERAQADAEGMVGDPELRELAEASRTHADVALGASPRASLCLLRCARARALLDGRHYFTHEDVHAVAPGVLGHRLIIRPEAEVEGRRALDVVRDLIASVPVLTSE